MEWQTPADEHWANNYTVSFRASCNSDAARYVATHLPTNHREIARTRVGAIERLAAWVATQDAPTRPMPEGSVTSLDERRRMMQVKMQSALTKRGG